VAGPTSRKVLASRRLPSFRSLSTIAESLPYRPIGPAHLGLARANTLDARSSQGIAADGARVRALAAYKDFLTLWKDADPDTPILKEAKAEYAKLQ